jgi:phage terminase large subunit-like protein
MSQPTNPSEKEMLELIDDSIEAAKSGLIDGPPLNRAIVQARLDRLQAIRRLIVAVGEWQSHAMAILFCSELPEYVGTDMMDFMKEIRDFGKKGQ